MTKITNGLPAIHPGKFLLEILTEIGLSQAQFARNIGVSAMRVSHVINGTRPVTAELAHLIGKAFGQSPQYWMNLQVDYDLKTVARALKPQIENVRRLEALAAS
ncbi:MAG: HigA family addiction module antidote protein [Zoogloeaceae bacterium]|jgi:addiction module HigA family antidote|nr:HigA family addiction module antidote protein [Zoogloeaceae bacterium]